MCKLNTPRIAFVLSAALLCASCSKKAAKSSKNDEGQRWVLKKLVTQEPEVAKWIRKGLTFELMAEVQRGNRRAAVFWPALQKGRIVDNDIVAIVYERSGKGWKQVSRTFGVHRRDGKATLDQKLGGTGKLQIIRACGVKRSELAAHVEKWGRAFLKHLSTQHDKRAMHAYGQLIRAFSFDLAAHATVLQAWLINAVKRPELWPRVATVEEKSAILELKFGGRVGRARANLIRCGKGWVLDKPIRTVQ